MSQPTKQQVLGICNSIRDVDDQLGRFSDYEGGQNGPTWAVWNVSKEIFAARCEQSITLHQQAITRWKRAAALNARR